MHRAVAARIFQVPESEVNESKRRVAKTVNFGVIYGLSAFGLAAGWGLASPRRLPSSKLTFRNTPASIASSPKRSKLRRQKVEWKRSSAGGGPSAASSRRRDGRGTWPSVLRSIR